MGNRELLELAAKAAGISGGWGDKIEYHNGAVDLRDVWILEGDDFVPWNPLTDDGDALRLACVLGLTVECDFHDSDTCTAYQTKGDIVADEQAGMVGEVIGEPDFAATRRAIVRAAAEIGRAM